MAHFNANHRELCILLVKTSSLGDVLHNLPVVSDIVRHYPGAQIDWLVEESYTALPRLHSAVRNAIPVAWRRWRSRLLNSATWREIATFRDFLAALDYDVAIDTQGLLKSALLMHGTQGLRCGFDKHSARESLSSILYQKSFPVAKGQHAVERNRQLVAQALDYTLDGPADYGIHAPSSEGFEWLGEGSYAVLLHSTSRAEKMWDESNWIALGRYFSERNIRSVLPWGSENERLRSLRLAESITGAKIPPRLNLNEAASLFGAASSVIGVDTGLAHLAAALKVPTVGIYTATDPALTGLHAGDNAVNLGGISQSPHIATVISELQKIMAGT